MLNASASAMDTAVKRADGVSRDPVEKARPSQSAFVGDGAATSGAGVFHLIPMSGGKGGVVSVGVWGRGDLHLRSFCMVFLSVITY